MVYWYLSPVGTHPLTGTEVKEITGDAFNIYDTFTDDTDTSEDPEVEPSDFDASD